MQHNPENLAILGDHLSEQGHPLGPILAGYDESGNFKAKPGKYERPTVLVAPGLTAPHKRRRDLEAPDHGVKHVIETPSAFWVNAKHRITKPITPAQKESTKLAAEWPAMYEVSGSDGSVDSMERADNWLRTLPHTTRQVLMSSPYLSSHRPFAAYDPQATKTRIKWMESAEHGIHRAHWLPESRTLIMQIHNANSDQPFLLTAKPNLKLSRATTDLLSKSQRVRRMLAHKIATEARLKVQTEDAKLRDRADVIQEFSHVQDHKGVEYAAAWYGLLSKAPNLKVFHVGEGPDTLHQWDTTDPDILSKLPDGASVTKSGRVRGANLDPKFVPQGATVERGTLVPMDSRQHYLDTIRSYENDA